MTPLESATTDELAFELKRRSRHGVIMITGYAQENGDQRLTVWWGDAEWRVGACAILGNAFKQAAYEANRSTFLGEEQCET